MRSARRKRPTPPAAPASEPRPAFAWPSRADAAQRASTASEMADAALTRLRATHAPRPVAEEALPASEQAAAGDADLWNREFDELANRLIQDLSRDLGPARSDRDGGRGQSGAGSA